MVIEKMKSIPKTRNEFERNFNILARKLENQEINMASGDGHDRIIPSLKKLVALPNSRLDILSVDEAARVMANTISSHSV